MVKNFFNKNNFQKENSLGFLTSLLQQSHKILKSVGNKKAELTTQQLVGIIILIISFGVVLFLFLV